MFYSVSGILVHTEPNLAVVECSGVGSKCFTSMNTRRSLPQIDKKVRLFTHLSMHKDTLDLFGFYTMTEFNCFKMLTSVSGVGVKVGVSILSEFSPGQIALVVASGDSKTLSRASGMGPKLAQHIALELKDKVKKVGAATVSTGDTVVDPAIGNAAGVVNALAILGWSPAEATQIVGRFDSNLPAGELIRLSSKSMRGEQ